MLNPLNEPNTSITIQYTNYRGETGMRHIVPINIQFTATEHHPEPQWILEALDLDKNANRSFAIKDILKWHVDVPK
jgi:hypothetical protein